jgi:hypothetical protein
VEWYDTEGRDDSGTEGLLGDRCESEFGVLIEDEVDTAGLESIRGDGGLSAVFTGTGIGLLSIETARGPFATGNSAGLFSIRPAAGT